jgi:hypothetical protein
LDQSNYSVFVPDFIFKLTPAKEVFHTVIIEREGIQTMAPEIDQNTEDVSSAGDVEEEGSSPMVSLRFYPTGGGSGGENDGENEEVHHFEDDEDEHDDPDVIIDTGRKVVTFADDEAEKLDARRDKARSRQELLSKITRLTDSLKITEQQLAIEKEKRKKKEKNLLKLAKELKKRNQKRESEREKDLSHIEEVRCEIC